MIDHDYLDAELLDAAEAAGPEVADHARMLFHRLEVAPGLRPHPSYMVGWAVVQAGGMGASLAEARWWPWYFAAVALLEAIGIGRKVLKARSASGTWSWVVWWWRELVEEFEHPATRIAGEVAVAAWSLAFIVGFATNGWWGPSIDTPVAMVFGVWLWWHFFERRGRGAARTAQHYTAPRA